MCAVLPGWRVLPVRSGEGLHRSEAIVVSPAASGRVLQTSRDDTDRQSIISGEVRTDGARQRLTSASRAFAPAASVVREAKKAVPVTRERGGVRRNLTIMVAVVWLAGFFVAMLPVVLGAVSLAVLRWRSVEIGAGEWARMVAEVSAKLRLRRRVVLLQSDRRSVPMTWGVIRPKVLVSAEASGWDRERRRAVLLHELAHVKRGDCLSDLVAQVTCAVYWFCPLAWVGLVKMRELRERACDDMALAAGCEATGYAEQLVEIAGRLTRGRLMAGGIAMARHAAIKERVERILDDGQRRGSGRRAAGGLAGAAMVCVVVPLAMLRAADQKPVASSPNSGVAKQILGDVLGADGKPVVGAEVEGLFVRYPKESIAVPEVEVFGRARSRADGTFEFQRPREPGEGEHTYVRATGPGLAYGYSLVRKDNGREYFYDDQHHEELDRPSIVLGPEAHIRGVVVDESGKPLSGVKVVQRFDAVTTGADGQFLFDKVGPSQFGMYATHTFVSVRLPGYVPKQLRLEEGITVEKPAEFRVTLEKGMLVRGKMSDAESGKPLQGFWLRAEAERDQGGSPEVYYATADREGRYEMRVPARHVSLYPYAAGNLPGVDWNYFPVIDVKEVRNGSSGGVVEEDFTFRHARSITGKIVGAEGLESGIVYLEAKPVDAEPNWRATSHFNATISADGTYRVDQLRPGAYELSLNEHRNGRGQGQLVSVRVNVKQGEDVSGLTLELPHGVLERLKRELRGVVRYSDGTPVRGAKISLMPEVIREMGDSGSTASAAADGTFAFRGFDAERKWTLWAQDPAGKEGKSVELASAEQSKGLLEIRLEVGTGFSGVVMGSEGKGLAGYRVSICDVRPEGQFTAHRPILFATTDEHGRYAINGFVPPTGVSGFLLEAWPPMLVTRERRSQTSKWYEDLPLKPGVVQEGFDFVVEETGTHREILTKRNGVTQPVEGK